MCRSKPKARFGSFAVATAGVFVATSVNAASPDLPIVIDPRYVGPPATAKKDQTSEEHVVNFLPKVKLEIATQAVPCKEGIVSCLANNFTDTHHQTSAATPSGALLLFFPIVSMNPNQASNSLPRDRQFIEYRHFENQGNRVPVVLQSVEEPESDKKGKPLLIVAEDVEGEALNKRAPAIDGAKKENEHADSSIVRRFMHRRNDLLLSEEPDRSSGQNVNRYVLGVEKTFHNANNKNPNTSGHPQEVLDLVPAQTSDIIQNQNVTNIFGAKRPKTLGLPHIGNAAKGSPLSEKADGNDVASDKRNLQTGPQNVGTSNGGSRKTKFDKITVKTRADTKTRDLSNLICEGGTPVNKQGPADKSCKCPPGSVPLRVAADHIRCKPVNLARQQKVRRYDGAARPPTRGSSKIPSHFIKEVTVDKSSGKPSIPAKGQTSVHQDDDNDSSDKTNMKDMTTTKYIKPSSSNAMNRQKPGLLPQTQLVDENARSRLSCEGGKIKKQKGKNKCVCPTSTRLLHLSKDKYRCVVSSRR